MSGCALGGFMRPEIIRPNFPRHDEGDTNSGLFWPLDRSRFAHYFPVLFLFQFDEDDDKNKYDTGRGLVKDSQAPRLKAWLRVCRGSLPLSGSQWASACLLSITQPNAETELW